MIHYSTSTLKTGIRDSCPTFRRFVVVCANLYCHDLFFSHNLCYVSYRMVDLLDIDLVPQSLHHKYDRKLHSVAGNLYGEVNSVKKHNYKYTAK